MRAPCIIDGCERPNHGRGMCTTHYLRWRLGKPLNTPVRKLTPVGDWCSEPDCLRAPVARGLCWAHYQRAIGRSKATGPVKPNGNRHLSRSERHQALIDDVTELLDWGCGTDEIAHRVGYKTPTALARQLLRLGRPDLAQPLQRRVA